MLPEATFRDNLVKATVMGQSHADTCFAALNLWRWDRRRARRGTPRRRSLPEGCMRARAVTLAAPIRAPQRADASRDGTGRSGRRRQQL